MPEPPQSKPRGEATEQDVASGPPWARGVAKKAAAEALASPAISPRQRAFLAAYPDSPTVAAAAQAAGVSRRSHPRWMQSSEAYRVAFAAAVEARGERYMRETMDRVAAYRAAVEAKRYGPPKASPPVPE